MIFKKPLAILAILSSLPTVSWGCIENNCLRALKNTARNGLADCSSFFQVTVIPPTSTFHVTVTLPTTISTSTTALDVTTTTETDTTTTTAIAAATTTETVPTTTSTSTTELDVTTTTETDITTDSSTVVTSTTEIVPTTISTSTTELDVTTITTTDTVTSPTLVATTTTTSTTYSVIPHKRRKRTTTPGSVTISPTAIPIYASACSSAGPYSSACSCLGASHVTITASAPSTTITATAIPTIAIVGSFTTLSTETDAITVPATDLTTTTAIADVTATSTLVESFTTFSTEIDATTVPTTELTTTTAVADVTAANTQILTFTTISTEIDAATVQTTSQTTTTVVAVATATTTCGPGNPYVSLLMPSAANSYIFVEGGAFLTLGNVGVEWLIDSQGHLQAGPDQGVEAESQYAYIPNSQGFANTVLVGYYNAVNSAVLAGQAQWVTCTVNQATGEVDCTAGNNRTYWYYCNPSGFTLLALGDSNTPLFCGPVGTPQVSCNYI